MKRSKTLLNLRSAPRVRPDTLIGQLLYGEPMMEVADSSTAGWSKVKAKIQTGEVKEGYVATRYLRESVSDGKENLMYNGIKEWQRFDYGQAKEFMDPYYKYVGEMWQSIQMDLDGRDRDVPWSAAFISFVVRNAGPGYAGFTFAAAHARYIHDAIHQRITGTQSPFWGYRLQEEKPQLGDMVCAWREVRTDFDHAKNHRYFKSHCDIIIEIKQANVKAIGGNVSNSVAIKNYQLDGNGFLRPTRNVFALLKNLT